MDNLAHTNSEVSLQAFSNLIQTRSDEEQWELIDGVPICLAAPSSIHQDFL